jgi:hypothetical protein
MVEVTEPDVIKSGGAGRGPGGPHRRPKRRAQRITELGKNGSKKKEKQLTVSLDTRRRSWSQTFQLEGTMRTMTTTVSIAAATAKVPHTRSY